MPCGMINDLLYQWAVPSQAGENCPRSPKRKDCKPNKRAGCARHGRICGKSLAIHTTPTENPILPILTVRDPSISWLKSPP